MSKVSRFLNFLRPTNIYVRKIHFESKIEKGESKLLILNTVRNQALSFRHYPPNLFTAANQYHRKHHEHHESIPCYDWRFLKMYWSRSAAKSNSGNNLPALIDRIVLYHGPPKIIITDRGSNFTSRLLNSLCKELKTKHKTVTVDVTGVEMKNTEM